MRDDRFSGFIVGLPDYIAVSLYGVKQTVIGQTGTSSHICTRNMK